jgi:outer membrane protein OmpA-like peptidoglycan-associated protein
MNLQSLKSFSFLILLAGLLGCAAQSSFKAYYDARDNLAKAKKLDPGHPFIPRAEIELEAGQRALNEARYSRATRSFQLVNRDADRIIQARSPQAKAELKETEIQPLTDVQRWTEQRANPDESSAEAPGPFEAAPKTANPGSVKQGPRSDPKERDRMNLPAEALARYLAQKSVAPSPQKEPSAPPLVASEPVPVEPIQNPVTKEPGSAPSAAPESAAKDLPQVAAKPQDQTRKSGSRQRLEETIHFFPSETQILPKAQGELDRLSLFLLENPSFSLKLKAGQALGEDANLPRVRFEAIRDYLEAKGVARDQVQLDPETISDKKPVFELYLLEH